VFYMLITFITWASIPILLLASMLSRFTASYEFLVDLLICLAATIIALWAVRSKKYVLAAGFVAVAIVFSPFLLVSKIFLLMILTCTASLITAFATFRKQPLPVR
jgi:hypothetical protein